MLALVVRGEEGEEGGEGEVGGGGGEMGRRGEEGGRGEVGPCCPLHTAEDESVVVHVPNLS